MVSELFHYKELLTFASNSTSAVSLLSLILNKIRVTPLYLRLSLRLLMVWKVQFNLVVKAKVAGLAFKPASPEISKASRL